jgi:hypothetical protein
MAVAAFDAESDHIPRYDGETLHEFARRDNALRLVFPHQKTHRLYVPQKHW